MSWMQPDIQRQQQDAEQRLRDLQPQAERQQGPFRDEPPLGRLPRVVVGLLVLLLIMICGIFGLVLYLHGH